MKTIIVSKILTGHEYKGSAKSWPGFDSKVMNCDKSDYAEFLIISNNHQILPVATLELSARLPKPSHMRFPPPPFPTGNIPRAIVPPTTISFPAVHAPTVPPPPISLPTVPPPRVRRTVPPPAISLPSFYLSSRNPQFFMRPSYAVLPSYQIMNVQPTLVPTRTPAGPRKANSQTVQSLMNPNCKGKKKASDQNSIEKK